MYIYRGIEVNSENGIRVVYGYDLVVDSFYTVFLLFVTETSEGSFFTFTARGCRVSSLEVQRVELLLMTEHKPNAFSRFVIYTYSACMTLVSFESFERPTLHSVSGGECSETWCTRIAAGGVSAVWL